MRTGTPVDTWKVVPLASESVAVFTSPDPEKVHLGHPSVLALPGGRIVVAMDLLGPGVRKLPGAKGKHVHFNHWVQGKIFTSNDKGLTWSHRQDYSFGNACLFRDGNSIYLLGHKGNIQIVKSSDGGETWSRPAEPTTGSGPGDSYRNSPASVLLANGNIYVPMMLATDLKHKGDPAGTFAAVLLRASQGSDLLAKRSWTASEPITAFRDLVPHDELKYFGIPFFDVPEPNRGVKVAENRWANRIGWSAPHAVLITDPNHCWHDPTGRTIHVVARAHCHRSNMAAFAKFSSDAGGRMKLDLETTPAGGHQVFLPVPGGNMNFHLLRDAESGLFWLLSNLVADSMTRAEKLPRDRYGLPCDECHRLQLSFSGNLVDWCFAGYVDTGASPKQSRHHASMAVRGNDLCIVMCSGDDECRSPYYSNRITFHMIPSFRDLVY